MALMRSFEQGKVEARGAFCTRSYSELAQPLAAIPGLDNHGHAAGGSANDEVDMGRKAEDIRVPSSGMVEEAVARRLQGEVLAVAPEEVHLGQHIQEVLKVVHMVVAAQNAEAAAEEEGAGE